jgi:hypothetical protein
VVVNALLTLLEGGRFEHWQQGGSGGAAPAAAPHAGSHVSGAAVAMDYIIGLVAAGRVTVKPSSALLLLQHLVTQALTADSAGAAAGATSHAGQQQAGAAADPYEQLFIGVVRTVGVAVAAASVGPPGVDAAMGLSPAQAQQALQLAAQARFVRAAASIHHQQGDYRAALSCYLALASPTAAADDGGGGGRQQGNTPQQQPAQQPQQRAAVFDYIESVMQSGGGGNGSSGSNSSSGSNTSSGPAAQQAFMACVLEQVVPLIRRDPGATAALLLTHAPDQQVPVLLSLQQEPQLQFRFLRAAMQQQVAPAGTSPAVATPPQGSPGKPGVAGGAASGGSSSESLLERPDVALMYVRLLAQYEPSAVLCFLQSHHQYSVAEAIQVCRAAGALRTCGRGIACVQQAVLQVAHMLPAIHSVL